MAHPYFLTHHDFEYGVLETVGPGIRRLTARNPSAFTFHGTGTYVIGEGDVAVIDPGPADSTHINMLVESLQGENITRILVTHCHMDHSPGARLLQKFTDAPTYGFGPHGTHQSIDGDSGEEGVDVSFTPDVEVKEGDTIRAGLAEIECVHTPGHTSNHMCFALPKTGDLFTGDHVMGWSTSVVIPPYGNMSDYINSLEKLLTRSDHCYWPTHGPPIGDPKIFVKSLIAHRLKRIKDIVALLEIGPLSISEMVKPLYPQIDPRLIGAASRSIFASLIYLIDKKIIACDSAVSLQSIFRTIER